MMHFKNGFCEKFHYSRIPHLPDSEWTTIKKVFNAKVSILKYKLRPKTLICHVLKDNRFYLFLTNSALKLAVKKDSLLS